MKCSQGYEIKVLKSNAGYYLGTVSEEGLPNCRLSEEYYPNEDAAKNALDNGFYTERESVENLYCNGFISCVED